VAVDEARDEVSSAPFDDRLGRRRRGARVDRNDVPIPDDDVSVGERQAPLGRDDCDVTDPDLSDRAWCGQRGRSGARRARSREGEEEQRLIDRLYAARRFLTRACAPNGPRVNDNHTRSRGSVLSSIRAACARVRPSGHRGSQITIGNPWHCRSVAPASRRRMSSIYFERPSPVSVRCIPAWFDTRCKDRPGALIAAVEGIRTDGLQLCRRTVLVREAVPPADAPCARVSNVLAIAVFLATAPRGDRERGKCSARYACDHGNRDGVNPELSGAQDPSHSHPQKRLQVHVDLFNK
jgi:hypothetical protein